MSIELNTWHHGSGGGGSGLTFSVYDGLPGQRRRLALTPWSWTRRRPTLALDLTTSRGRRLSGEARHGGQHRRLNVQHLDVIFTLDQPLLRRL